MTDDTMNTEQSRVAADCPNERLVMPRCATCAHWGGRSKWANKEHKKTCNSPKIEYGYSGPESPSDGADIEDDEGWGMLTGPDFGCVNWEPKEA